jgi:hypothetical protein
MHALLNNEPSETQVEVGTRTHVCTGEELEHLTHSDVEEECEDRDKGTGHHHHHQRRTLIMPGSKSWLPRRSKFDPFRDSFKDSFRVFRTFIFTF